jgi:tRNA pseudouridine38-40 synthase
VLPEDKRPPLAELLATRDSPLEDSSARRLRLLVTYDGSDFYGAQVQPGKRTVGSELEVAIATLTGTLERVTFAGRTDRGVHAAGQVAHCTVTTALTDEQLLRGLNALLPEDAAVLQLATVASEFHARYDALWREYRYRIWNAAVRLPLLARTTWHVGNTLDLTALATGAAHLLGEHDFAAFAGQGLGVPGKPRSRSTVRRVNAADWSLLPLDYPAPAGKLVELRIRASGFLPQMVRTIVGALAEVGRGHREPDWITALLAEQDRAQAPAPAPPQGLILWAVGYGSQSVAPG